MGIQEDRLPAPCQCLGSKLQDIQLALGAETEEAAIRAASGREGLKGKTAHEDTAHLAMGCLCSAHSSITEHGLLLVPLGEKRGPA